VTHRKTEKKKKRQLADGRERGGGGAKSYDSEKACSSIQHSIFSDFKVYLASTKKEGRLREK
jgi:hypothetical protein